MPGRDSALDPLHLLEAGATVKIVGDKGLPDAYTAVRSRPARALVRAVLQVAGPTVTPAPLPLAWQAGRRQFGLDRGRPQHWKLEILQGPSAPRAGHGI
jgi:hypothetical protein